MATFLKNLRRSGSSEDLTELRQLADRLDSQHTNLERLVQHADRSIGQLQRLSTLGERVSVLEKQLATLEHLPEKIGAATTQVGALTATHEKLASGLADANAGIERAKAQSDSLSETVSATMQLKEELASFLAMRQPFGQLRRDVSGGVQARKQEERVHHDLRAAGRDESAVPLLDRGLRESDPHRR